MRSAAVGSFVVSVAAFLMTALIGPGPAGSQEAPKAALLEIRGEVARPLTLSRDDFAGLTRRSIRARAHDGKESEYQGVPLIDLLARAGVPAGTELRGKALSLYVVAEAADGYRATFALAELDSTFTDRVILMADRRDGQLLTSREGPLQVVVPGEKKHARWVRQVTRLVVGRG